MKQFSYIITDELGIHARPAGVLAKVARNYADTEITVDCNGKKAKVTQLLKLMSLGVKQGSTVTIAAEGPDEEEAIAAMDDFFKANL